MDSPGLTIQSSKTTLEERFPRIVDSIVLMWGNKEMDTFFQKIMMDDRGDRQGFPPEVMSDLMFLSQLHNTAYPFQNASDTRYYNGIRMSAGFTLR
jgi:hypothetical protein